MFIIEQVFEESNHLHFGECQQGGTRTANLWMAWITARRAHARVLAASFVLLLGFLSGSSASAKAVLTPAPRVEFPYALIIWWVVCVLLVVWISARKNRNTVPWAIAAVFFNLIALVSVIFVRTKNVAVSSLDINQRLEEINAGSLKPFIPNGVVPIPSETFLWEQRAVYGQTQKEHRTRGSNPAVYVPLGHGVRTRLGGWQGSSRQVSDFAWGPHGIVYVSNARLLFKADDGSVAQTPLNKIITYDAFNDGLGLNVNGIGVVQFKTGDSCLGVLVLKIMKASQTALPI